MRKLTIIAFFGIAALCRAQGADPNSTFEGYPAMVLSNGKLQLTVMQKGGTLANLVLTDDSEKVSPYWNPMRMARELGKPVRFDGGAGHFVCVDGFGPPSPEERAAGLPMHGEAHTETYPFQVHREENTVTATLTAKLPIVQETFTRTFRMLDGENVISVKSELQSLLGFDRPVNWAEHATIGSPFLEPGVTVVNLSGTRSRTRPYTETKNGQTERRLTSGQDFTWPMAPGLDGKEINVSETPVNPHYLDHATTLLDPARDLEWVTALNPKDRLVLGYIFKRSEYPWLQYWGNYPPTGKLARGMEFSTQPFDVPRREAISMGTMFDTPTYRWLPAKSKIGTEFLVFYARVPEGFKQVDNVTLENGQIVVEDRSTNHQVVLRTRAQL